MATSPAFIGTARIGRCSLSTINTATDGTGTITDLIVGASTGTRVLEIAAKGTATTVSALIRIFTFDGTNWDLFDELTVTAVTGAVTTTSFRTNKSYTNLVLPSASWKLGCTITVAPTSGTVRVFAFGGDL